MKITIEKVPECTLEKFAEDHTLEMVVTERTVPGLPKWYARFKDVEVSEGGCLIGVFGNGETPEQAIENYRSLISLKTLAVNALRKNDKRLSCPRLIP